MGTGNSNLNDSVATEEASPRASEFVDNTTQTTIKNVNLNITFQRLQNSTTLVELLQINKLRKAAIEEAQANALNEYSQKLPFLNLEELLQPENIYEIFSAQNDLTLIQKLHELKNSSTPKKNKDAVYNLKVSVESNKKEHDSKANQNQELILKNRDLAKSIALTLKKVEQLSADLSEAQDMVEVTKNNKNRIAAEKIKLESQLKLKQDKLSHIEKKSSTLTENVNRYNSKINNLDSIIKKNKANIKELKEEILLKESERKKYKKTLEDKKDEKKTHEDFLKSEINKTANMSITEKIGEVFSSGNSTENKQHFNEEIDILDEGIEKTAKILKDIDLEIIEKQNEINYLKKTNCQKKEKLNKHISYVASNLMAQQQNREDNSKIQLECNQLEAKYNKYNKSLGNISCTLDYATKVFEDISTNLINEQSKLLSQQESQKQNIILMHKNNDDIYKCKIEIANSIKTIAKIDAKSIFINKTSVSCSPRLHSKVNREIARDLDAAKLVLENLDKFMEYTYKKLDMKNRSLKTDPVGNKDKITTINDIVANAGHVNNASDMSDPSSLILELLLTSASIKTQISTAINNLNNSVENSGIDTDSNILAMKIQEDTHTLFEAVSKISTQAQAQHLIYTQDKNDNYNKKKTSGKLFENIENFRTALCDSTKRIILKRIKNANLVLSTGSTISDIKHMGETTISQCSTLLEQMNHNGFKISPTVITRHSIDHEVESNKLHAAVA